MFPFIFITIFSLILAHLAERFNRSSVMLLCALSLALFSGFRGENVGIDTENYYAIYYSVLKGRMIWGVEGAFQSLCDFLQNFSTNPALLVFTLSFLTNILIVSRLWTFRKKCSFWVMIAIYMAGYYPMSMNIMRQFFSVALVFFGSIFFEKNKPLYFLPFFCIAFAIHNSAIVGVIPLITSLWNFKKQGIWKLVLSFLFIFLFIFLFSKIANVFFYYSKYLAIVNQNIGFMLIYKTFILLIVLIISKIGLIRYGNRVIGIEKIDKYITLFYFVGLCLCSLGMFLPYVDRIGLYFLMYEMPFWGYIIKKKDLSMAYSICCFIFILYLYIGTLIGDGHHIFPYTTIWSK